MLAQNEGDRRLYESKDQALGLIDEVRPNSIYEIDRGLKEGTENYQAAQGLFQPYRDAGLKAFSAYGDAAGLNGAAGSDAATAAFRASPGYAWQRDQAIDGVARKASSLGILGSGNTETGIATLASNLADQQWGSYMTGLKGIADTGYAATGAQAGLQKGIGDLDVARGNSVANIWSADGLRKAGIVSAAGQAAAGSYTNFGNTLGSNLLTAGKAEDAGANNLWGALLGGAKLLTGAFK